MELIDEERSPAETMVGQELLMEYKSAEKTCTAQLWSFEHGGHNDSGASTSLAELQFQLHGMKVTQQEMRVSLRKVFSEREKTLLF